MRLAWPFVLLVACADPPCVTLDPTIDQGIYGFVTDTPDVTPFLPPRPVPNSLVAVVDSNRTTVAQAHTDIDGAYQVALPAGTFALTLWPLSDTAPTSFTLEAGQLQRADSTTGGWAIDVSPRACRQR